MKDHFDAVKDPARKKNSGRPKKSDDLRRAHKISSAYTQEEFAVISRQASTARTSPSIYQRMAALNGTVMAKDTGSGLRLALLQKMLIELRHCRATYHKIERRTAHGDRAEIQKHLMAINDLITVITITLRQEVGLGPR